MKKSIFALTLALLILPISGCMGSQAQKANPEQEIKNVLVKLQEDYANQDIEGIMSVYSEDCSGSRGEKKAQIEQFIYGMKDQGYLSDTEVVFDDVEIEVDGDTATANQVTYSGGWGLRSYKYTFNKEDSAWRIVATEQVY